MNRVAAFVVCGVLAMPLSGCTAGSLGVTGVTGTADGAAHPPYRVLGRDEFASRGRAACEGNG